MQHNMTNILLASADRLSSRLGPVSNLIDRVVEHVVPQATAKAVTEICAAGTVSCYATCDTSAWQCWTINNQTRHIYYGYNQLDCDTGNIHGSCDGCIPYGPCYYQY